MTTPSFLAYRTTSSQINGLNPGTLQDRVLACLAALVSNQNPDGTTRGS
jgi:hypothetical protein